MNVRGEVGEDVVSEIIVDTRKYPCDKAIPEEDPPKPGAPHNG